MSNCSPSWTPARGSPVTLRTVLPQPSREESPESEISRMNFAASGSGMWWTWMFWRVVMWPLLRGAYFSIASANASIWSGVIPPSGSFVRIICTFGLALAVDALLQAEADELVLGGLTVEELAGLGVEVVELALEDRDHVPGDVLVDLGVLERAELALALLLLALMTSSVE